MVEVALEASEAAGSEASRDQATSLTTPGGRRVTYVCSPVTGVVAPLEDVGEDRFALCLDGGGTAIEPLIGEIRAPFDGHASLLDPQSGTVQLRGADGLEIRVRLTTTPASAGQGALSFAVQPGAAFERGDVVARFDLDGLARGVESLHCMVQAVCLASGDRIRVETGPGRSVRAGESRLLALVSGPPATGPGHITLLAPVSGMLVPLGMVPDPVFAGRLVGDGVSIEPTGTTLHAPIDGEVIQLHPSLHALTLRGVGGLEILLHIGIDTVKLRGEGFQSFVREGDKVTAGQILIRFDPDAVARRAPSLLTQMLVTNMEQVASLDVCHGFVEAGRDPACMVGLVAEPVAGAIAQPDTLPPQVSSAPVLLPNPVGLHARPAANLVALAKKFRSDIRLTRLADTAGGNSRPQASANARSVVAILGLATRLGDSVSVQARGEDADAAVSALAALLAAGCGESLDTPALTPAAESFPRPDVHLPCSLAPGVFSGVPASPGLAIGRIWQWRTQPVTVVERGGNPADELAHFARALVDVGETLRDQAARDPDPIRSQILAAHRELLDDPDLHVRVREGIQTGQSAAYAWQASVQAQVDVLAGLENPLLRERANDLRDVGRRLLVLLAGAEDRPPEIPPGSIVVAEELTPSETARFERGVVLGFCTTTGGATSHVAILARSLGLPALCGADPALLDLADGTTVILDGDAGMLDSTPTGEALDLAQKRRQARQARAEWERASAHRPALTLDGLRIEVAANVNGPEQTEEAVAAGADGVGLLRSEFLFDRRDAAPGEDEQAEACAAAARALGPERILVVRTLDVGGDKPLSYLPLPREDNPFLGMRGLRVSLMRPALFRTQLRAILRAAHLTRLHVMFPMVTSVSEFRAARALLEEERAALGAPPVSVGVMIEVPAAALLAEILAREADFFSIGTNDLTQYILAMDRGHPQLARQADALHPAVLHAIRLTCEGARAHGRWVGVCGGLAADPLAVPLLVGLGVDELSVPVPAIAGVKAAVVRCERRRCTALAEEILSLATPEEVRARLFAAPENQPDESPPL
jgi:multiphosphoryl transfer protein